jgi:hypothetical protein
VLSQTLQPLRNIRGSGDLVAEMPPKLVDFGSRGRKSDAFVVTMVELTAKPAQDRFVSSSVSQTQRRRID